MLPRSQEEASKVSVRGAKGEALDLDYSELERGSEVL